MKNQFVKLACIAAALAILLTGCSLIAVDPVMQADEDMKALVKNYAATIATYDGGEITKFDVMSDFTNQYAYLYYIYSMYGYAMDDTQTLGILEGVVNAHMNTRAAALKAEELGIALTDEEIAECEEAAQTAYDEAYQEAYANAEGDTDEVKALNTDIALYSQGVTYDFYVNQQKWTLIVEKVEELVKADAPEITDAELESRLAIQAIEDESLYTNDPASFETDMTDPAIVPAWIPEGYRTVKHILLIPEGDELTAVREARTARTTAETALSDLSDELAALSEDADDSARTAEEIQADIDAKTAEIADLDAALQAAEAACLAAVQDSLDAVYAALDAGEDFDAVMAEYGEDPGMQSEPAMSRGYYVSETSTTWDVNFRDAAMALSAVGEYASEPVISSSGVHIVYYNSDVASGPVALEDIRDAYYEVALAETQDEYMAQRLAEWVSALNPQYAIEKFFD
ncbi:MAG: peptidylprolyl isomerase [Christensenellales bacterium]|jgi:parvulin-like peptidyl-prolyl isomerase